jgi:hypothetical protein
LDILDKKINTQKSKSMEISPVEAELLHADNKRDRETERQTDMTK